MLAVSLGHWNTPTLTDSTVILARKPSGYGALGPSDPRAKLKALESDCCSNWGSISTNQGVFWTPARIVGNAWVGLGVQIRPGGNELEKS